MAKSNIATFAYRTRTVCNTEINDYWYYYREGTGTTGSGRNLLWQRDDRRRINGSGPKKRVRALRINDRGDDTGLDEQEARGATTATTNRFRDVDRYVSIQTQCWCSGAKIYEIRLTWTTIQHNVEAGMRVNDLHRQRLQQRTGGLALVGLEKGGLFTS